VKFWDSSAIVPIVVQEPHSIEVRGFLHRDQGMIVWWGTLLECYSSLARRVKEGLFRDSELSRARMTLEGLSEMWTEILPGVRLRQSAERALFLHTLRAADSLQLASALVWARHEPHRHEFVCLDHRLREAARSEGFHVLPERF
jgi:predicted nucleic acid-binding protein